VPFGGKVVAIQADPASIEPVHGLADRACATPALSGYLCLGASISTGAYTGHSFCTPPLLVGWLPILLAWAGVEGALSSMDAGMALFSPLLERGCHAVS